MPRDDLLSGDPIADRRADYARMLEEGGDPMAAAELMEQALELVPGWAAGWYRLASLLEKAGQAEAAIAALDKVLALSERDIFGAQLKRAVLVGEAAPDLPPADYVERLFDDYADRFDQALVERLDYRVPPLLAAMIRHKIGAGRVRLCVDLGCGTGLLGAELANLCDRLEGFDLSANMLAKARAKGLYQHLAQADLSLSARESGLFADGLGAHRADLVTAADVLMYLGDLKQVFALAAELVTPGGLFAFSVEEARESEFVGEGSKAGFLLRPSLRYAHSEALLQDRLRSHGFTILDQQRHVIRTDGGKPIAGILFLAEKSR